MVAKLLRLSINSNGYKFFMYIENTIFTLDICAERSEGAILSGFTLFACFLHYILYKSSDYSKIDLLD